MYSLGSNKCFYLENHIQQNEKKIKQVYFVTNARNVDQINEQTFTNKTLKKSQRFGFDFIGIFTYRC